VTPPLTHNFPFDIFNPPKSGFLSIQSIYLKKGDMVC
jgi:hypothetical protein